MKILLCGIHEIFLSMFSSRAFMVSRLIFKSFIHLEFIFAYGARWWSLSFFCVCCIHRCKKQTFGDFQDFFRDVTLMANSFNLRRGGLSRCPGDTVLRRAADESRAKRSQVSPFIRGRSKQASYKTGGCCYLCIALGSGGTFARYQNFLLKPCLLLIRTICPT